MRERAKNLLELLLLQAGPAAISRRVFRSRCLILAYHNILPDGSAPGGDGSLHLPRDSFARQLEELIRRCDVVALDALLDGAHSRTERPRVAITFDDAYSGALTVGVAELTRRGLPATIFVSPGFIGGRSFWWDVLCAGSGDRLPEELRESALAVWRGQDSQVRANAQARGFTIQEVPGHACAATEAELHNAASVPGIVLGSHTWSHPNLTRLSDPDLITELERPLTWLRERFAGISYWLSYPYGIADGRVASAARSVGYRGGLLVEGGWLPSAPGDQFRLPRLNIPAGLSLNGFAVQIAGLLCR